MYIEWVVKCCVALVQLCLCLMSAAEALRASVEAVSSCTLCWVLQDSWTTFTLAAICMYIHLPCFVSQWCVVDSECGEARVQSDKDHTPQCLEKLMLCSTKLCTPDYIDRNFCFRVGLL